MSSSVRDRFKAIAQSHMLRSVLVLCGCSLFTITLYVEFRHWYNFGHLVSYGLHVDALNEDFNIAIPGQTKMYWAEISNFSLLPVRLPGCRFPSDTLHPPLEYAYSIQKYDEPSKSWQTLSVPHFEFCLEPESNESAVVYTYLLPGSSVEIMGGGAFGAMDAFRKNDLARFVVFRNVTPSADWATAIPSSPFRIEDDVQRNPDGSFRIQH
jgi:hypothetical protein